MKSVISIKFAYKLYKSRKLCFVIQKMTDEISDYIINVLIKWLLAKVHLYTPFIGNPLK